MIMMMMMMAMVMMIVMSHYSDRESRVTSIEATEVEIDRNRNYPSTVPL